MFDYEPSGQAMTDTKAILRLRIQTEEPVEIDAFVGAFTSLAEEYRRDIKDNYPDADSDARIFVKEVRKKCIEADLIPYVVAVAPFIAHMDQAVIIEQFVRSWGGRISALATGKLGEWSPKRANSRFLQMR